MHRYTLSIAYDGTDFCGWQEQQDNICTVTQTVRKAFEGVFKHRASIVGSSRTDAGVHALGQVARITTSLDLDPATIKRALNNALPPSIMVRSLDRTKSGFHPQHNVREKIYWYHVFTKRTLPCIARFGWVYPYPFDVEKLQTCLEHCIGTHDFWSFSAGPDKENPICTIYQASIKPLQHPGSGYRIIIGGNRFLYHMVRRIVGTSLLIASSSTRSPEEFPQAFAGRTSRTLFLTAAPEGLALRRIRYYPSKELTPAE